MYIATPSPIKSRSLSLITLSYMHLHPKTHHRSGNDTQSGGLSEEQQALIVRLEYMKYKQLEAVTACIITISALYT